MAKDTFPFRPPAVHIDTSPNPTDKRFLGWALRDAGSSTVRAQQIMDAKPDNWPDDTELVVVYLAE